MATKRKYILTTTYKDGGVSRFEFDGKTLLWEMAHRIHDHNMYGSVESWRIETTEEKNSGE